LSRKLLAQAARLPRDTTLNCGGELLKDRKENMRQPSMVIGQWSIVSREWSTILFTRTSRFCAVFIGFNGLFVFSECQYNAAYNFVLALLAVQVFFLFLIG